MVQVPPTGLDPWDAVADDALEYLDAQAIAERARAVSAEASIDARLISGSTRDLVFYRPGVAVVGVGVTPYPISGTFTVKKVVAAAGGAPLGSDLIFDVKKNGATIFTTTANRPKIVAGQTFGTSVAPDVTGLILGDKLTVDIVSIGVSVSGSEVTVIVVCSA